MYTRVYVFAYNTKCTARPLSSFTSHPCALPSQTWRFLKKPHLTKDASTQASRIHFSMSDPIDVTQSAEYLELLQVSEEMEADLMRQLAAKDAIIAEKQLESQAQITRLQADLVGRDKELEEFIAEVESTNNAALRAKDEEAAVLKQALEEARDKRAAAEVQRSAADASLSVAKDRINQLEAAANDAEEVAQQKQVEVHALQLQLQQLNASSAVCAVSFQMFFM